MSMPPSTDVSTNHLVSSNERVCGSMFLILGSLAGFVNVNVLDDLPPSELKYVMGTVPMVKYEGVMTVTWVSLSYITSGA